MESLTTKTTLRKLKDALTALPEGLDNTYDETMERINSQHPDQATLARKVLCWVFHAFHPLTMLEIQHALAVETGDSMLDEDNIPEQELLLSVCNGLVTYEKEGGFLALVHYTFQQYLERKAENLFPEAQVDIVRTCLTYLSFDEFEQGPCLEDQHLVDRHKRWPLLRYAVFTWSRHARKGAEEACIDLIGSFLSQDAKLSASVQVLWVREFMGANYSRQFPSEVSALWFASVYELEYTVSHLLASQRHSVNKTTLEGTALHAAAACGNVGISELLLSNGADVNAVDSDGKTALELSIRKGQKSLVQLLLAKNADVVLKDNYCYSPLTLAMYAGDDEITQVLLEYDLQRQVQCGILDEAMRTAAWYGRLSLLKMLLAKSPEQPAPDQEGRSLLHMSAYGGSLNCFQYIENSGFDLEAQDRQKRTCLHIAAAGTHAKSHTILEYLLERGLNPSQGDVDGWTPLLWAAKAGNIANIETLLEAGTGSFYQGDREWIPCAIATYHENGRAAAILRLHNRPLPEMFETHQSSISLQHPNLKCDGCELVSHRSFACLLVGEIADSPSL